MENKYWGMFLIAAVVLAVAIGWWGSTLQQAQVPTPTEVTTPSAQAVSLDVEATNSSIGHENNVTAAGNVSGSGTNASCDKLSIDNTENSESVSLNIAAKNPVTSEEGIPNALESEYFNVYYVYNGNNYLYLDGDYTNGYSLSVGAQASTTNHVCFEFDCDAPDGEFSDDESYNVEIYVHQVGTNYVEDVDYTIYT